MAPLDRWFSTLSPRAFSVLMAFLFAAILILMAWPAAASPPLSPDVAGAPSSIDMPAATMIGQGLPPSVPEDPLVAFIRALKGHQWAVLAGVVLGTIVAAALSHYSGLSRLWPWLTTDAGGTVWTFVLASIAAVATTLTAGQPLTYVTACASLGVGWLAIGGYTGARKLLGKSGGLGARWPVLDTIATAAGPVNPPKPAK